jgi:plasmid stability protein
MVLWANMKTTIELPDELMRAVKVRAANQGRKLKEVVADLLKRGLADEPKGVSRVQRRVQLPLVVCAHDARPEREMTPNRVAEVLAREEAKTARQRS